MKKFIIVLCFIIFSTNIVYALDKAGDNLAKIEDFVYGYNNSSMSKESRVCKLEKEVYGRTKNGSLNDRRMNLTKDLYIDVIGEKNDAIASSDYEEFCDDSVNYPILDEVEKRLNIKSVAGQDLNTRLSFIENKLFNKSNSADDFYTRVEKIKNKIGYSDLLAQSYDDNYYDYDDYNDYNDSQDISENRGFINPYNTYKLSILEQKILNDTYPYDNNDRRLARLENYIFSTDFSGDNDKVRISRLEEAIRTAHYSKQGDSKLHRTINTAMQIATMVLMVLAIIL